MNKIPASLFYKLFFVLLLFCLIIPVHVSGDSLVLISGVTIPDLSNRGKNNNDVIKGFVLIRDGLIEEVGKLSDIPVIQGKVDKIDGEGKYVLPGLIDGFAAINNQSYANAYLYMGVTTIIAVDGGRRGPFFGNSDPGPRALRLESVGDEKKSIADHLKDLELLHKNGYKIVLLKYALNPGQVRELVKRAHELGMGTIGEFGHTSYKEASGIGVDAFVHTTRYSLDLAPAEMAAAVADNPFSDDLESPKWKYYKFLSNLKKGDPGIAKYSVILGASGTFLMPTQSLSYLDIPGGKNPWKEPIASILDKNDINNPADKVTGKHTYNKKVQDAYTKLILNERILESAYYKSGAKYLAGSATDVWGTMPGISLHTELELLNRIGLTKREVIAAATSNFSEAFGWKLGKLKKGFAADLIILNSDPVEDLDNLKDIHLLIKDGKVIDRKALLKLPENGKIIKRQIFDLLDDQVLLNKVQKNNKLLNEFKYLEKIKTEKISYLSDGLRVTAYLVQPVAEGNYPCIIYNRGGNREFGSLNYSKIAFIMAKLSSYGYVVIGSQYRGNDGGEGKEEFGGEDVNDIINLIPLLKKIKNADPSRIGVYGWSRGGMMTYLALKRTPDIKAAVVGGGVADLFMMKKNRPDMEEFVFSELIPDYDENKKKFLSDRSAVKFVSQFPKNTPLLLMHGTGDWRVSPLQSMTLAGLLLKEKAPFRLVLFEGGDHGLTEFSAEVDKMVKEWFDKYLKRGEIHPSLVPHGR